MGSVSLGHFFGTDVDPVNVGGQLTLTSMGCLYNGIDVISVALVGSVRRFLRYPLGRIREILRKQLGVAPRLLSLIDAQHKLVFHVLRKFWFENH